MYIHVSISGKGGHCQFRCILEAKAAMDGSKYTDSDVMTLRGQVADVFDQWVEDEQSFVHTTWVQEVDENELSTECPTRLDVVNKYFADLRRGDERGDHRSLKILAEVTNGPIFLYERHGAPSVCCNKGAREEEKSDVQQ